MKIEKSVIGKMNECISDSPPETGGIFGSRAGEIVNEVVLDNNTSPCENRCAYYPNVDFFNCVIEEWQKNGITFMGIFHTHFFGVSTLSCGDKRYIKNIMNSMPECVEFLYFPIFVFPDRKLFCYKAYRVEKEIKIELEKTEIV